MILKEYGNSMDEEQRRKFGMALENTKLLSDLIEGLLNQPEIGHREILLSDVEMRGKSETVWQEIMLEHPWREIEFILGDMPPASGEETLRRQVIHNLFSNAVKFTNIDGRKALIETGSHCEKGYAVYFIRDNGAGFDMRYYDKLFRVLQRLHGTTEFEETGLGLAIVQSIIHRHGGKIWAEGETGKGATFYFGLPEKM